MSKVYAAWNTYACMFKKIMYYLNGLVSSFVIYFNSDLNEHFTFLFAKSGSPFLSSSKYNGKNGKVHRIWDENDRNLGCIFCITWTATGLVSESRVHVECLLFSNCLCPFKVQILKPRNISIPTFRRCLRVVRA